MTTVQTKPEGQVFFFFTYHDFSTRCLKQIVHNIMKREFNHWWSTIPPISTKRTITLNHWTQKKSPWHMHWKSKSCYGTGTKMWQG